MSELDRLRAELDEVDRALVALVGRRQSLVRAIGESKAGSGTPTRDFAREREVLDRVRAHAQTEGVRPEVAESLMRTLIRSSLEVQEQDRVAGSGQGAGRSALVIGGAGKMGRWFAGFLDTQGWRVDVSDPAASDADGFRAVDWEADALEHDLIVVATPLRATDAVLRQLAERKPRGLVFDLGSLKTPLRGGLLALAEAGVRVTSLHPMFGPDTTLLSGRHVIFVDLGDPSAVSEAKALFGDTMAVAVDMGLDAHDEAIAYVLGLSHALNIAFATALSRSGAHARRLATLSSTTFDAQLDVAARVTRESPALYYDIQALNDHGAIALDALVEAAESVRAAVRAEDPDGFRALMDAGRLWFEG